MVDYERLVRLAIDGAPFEGELLVIEARRRGDPRGLILGLCAQAPAAEAWEAMCAAVDGLEPGALESLHPTVSRLLESWPIALRSAPQHWMAQAAEEKAAPGLRWVRSLPLHRQWKGREPSFISHIIACCHPGSIAALDLAYNGLGPELGHAIAHSPGIEGLQTLNLSRNGLGDDGLAALLEGPYTLRELNLYGNDLTDVSASRLVRAGCAQNLQALSLSSNQLSGDAAGELVTLDALRSLNLSWNSKLSEAVVETLARASSLALDRLELCGTGAITPSSVQELLAAPHLSTLTFLNLGYNDTGAVLGEALRSATHLTDLCELQIESNALGPEGARAALEGKHLGSLEVLWLHGNAMGMPGARALRDAEHLSRLQTLLLGESELDPHACATLLGAQHWRQLRRFDLSNNSLGVEGALALSRCPLPRLEQLHAFRCDLGVEGTTYLAESDWPALSFAKLISNDLGVDGARALSRAPWLKTLRLLHVGLNDIADAGLAALTEGLGAGTLTEIDLRRNGITEAGLRAFLSSPAASELNKLFIDSVPQPRVLELAEELGVPLTA